MRLHVVDRLENGVSRTMECNFCETKESNSINFWHGLHAQMSIFDNITILS